MDMDMDMNMDMNMNMNRMLIWDFKNEQVYDDDMAWHGDG